MTKYEELLRPLFAVAAKSEDPSTKVGAIIYDAQGRFVSSGYNKFPPTIVATPELWNDRVFKYENILHAENVAFNSVPLDTPAEDVHTLCVTHPCCDRCVRLAVMYGIKRIVYLAPSDDFKERWGSSIEKALSYASLAGIEVFEKRGMVQDAFV